MKTNMMRITIFTFLAFIMLVSTGAGATVSGAIGNISGYSTDIEPADDITINLRNLMSWAVVYSGQADADGNYSLTNIDSQSYWIELIVADTDGQASPDYPSYTTGALLVVGQSDVTQNFTLPTLTNVYTLRINMAGDYVAGHSYTYSIKKASDFSEIDSGTGDSATVEVDLAEGTYRLTILAANYEPYEYTLAGDYEIYLDEPLTIDAVLTAAGGFDPDPPVVEVTHEATDTGFELSVVKENFTDTFAMAITGVGAVDPGDISGSGTADRSL